MSDNLIFHPNTAAQINHFLAHPNHALLIIGQSGSGKTEVTNYLAAELLNVPDSNNQQYIRQVNAKDGEGIAQIREIRNFLSLKTTGEQKIRRVVVVENADALGADAQNALLKTLEEPPEDTVILLTTSQKGRVLSTISSRTSLLKILPLTEEICLSVSGYSEEELKKAYTLSGGWAGLFFALLKSGNEHELISAISEAKQFLSKTTYQRLNVVDSISKNREEISQLLIGLEMCLHAMLRNSKTASLKSVHQKLTIVSNARLALNHSVNSKLLLCALSVNL